MKKRTKVLAALTLACLGIGGIIMEFTLNGGMGLIVTEKERQIAYLKEHEQEIVDYVKSLDDRIESVQIDWKETRWNKGGPMFDYSHYILIFGKFNGIEESSWGVTVEYDEDSGKIDLGTIGQNNNLMIGVEPF